MKTVLSKKSFSSDKKTQFLKKSLESSLQIVRFDFRNEVSADASQNWPMQRVYCINWEWKSYICDEKLHFERNFLINESQNFHKQAKFFHYSRNHASQTLPPHNKKESITQKGRIFCHNRVWRKLMEPCFTTRKN